jgi:hypothetical protein
VSTHGQIDLRVRSKEAPHPEVRVTVGVVFEGFKRPAAAASEARIVPRAAEFGSSLTLRRPATLDSLYVFKPSPAGDGPVCAGRHARPPPPAPLPGRPRAYGPPAMRRQGEVWVTSQPSPLAVDRLAGPKGVNPAARPDPAGSP